MARITSKPNISGLLENIIFVTDGDRQYVRSRPAQVRQSSATKRAAKDFGRVSRTEKFLRDHLCHTLGFPAIQYFPAKHRGRLSRCLSKTSESKNDTSVFKNPQPLTGLDFNPHLPAHKMLPLSQFNIRETKTGITIQWEELSWKSHIRTHKSLPAARVQLAAVSVFLYPDEPGFTGLQHLVWEVDAGKPIPAGTMELPYPKNGEWILVCITGEWKGKPLAAKEAHCGTYLYTTAGDY